MPQISQHPLFWDWDINDDNQIVSFALDNLPVWPSDDDGQDDDEADYETPLDPWAEEAENDYEKEDDLNDEEDNADYEDQQSNPETYNPNE